MSSLEGYPLTRWRFLSNFHPFSMYAKTSSSYNERISIKTPFGFKDDSSYLRFVTYIYVSFFFLIVPKPKNIGCISFVECCYKPRKKLFIYFWFIKWWLMKCPPELNFDPVSCINNWVVSLNVLRVSQPHFLIHQWLYLWNKFGTRINCLIEKATFQDTVGPCFVLIQVTRKKNCVFQI